MANKVAYIVSRFPHLPETFILREMIHLETLGWQIELYPLVIQRQELIHEEARPWLKRAHVVPWLSLGLWKSNFLKMATRPRQYISLLARVVRENIRSPKFLARALLLFPRAAWMADEFKAQGISHIHAHYASHPALVAWLINQWTGITYSVTVHAHDIFVDKSMLATKLHDSAFISAISEFNRTYLADRFGAWVNDKTQIVRCGIEPSYYQLKKQANGNGSGKLEIISVGSLQPYKGHIYLVKACAELLKRGIPFQCRIIGGGDLRAVLERAIQENQLEGRIELLGARTQDEVARFLRTANCYVQPSVVTHTGKMEGIPVALMEAMVSGIPVVATAISGVPELVRPGETGWLVPPEDVSALVEALTEISRNPAEAARRADLGRKWVLEEFELSSNVRKLANLFDRSHLILQTP
ncbi:MAG TPA: glycosyltransferase [Anaerolineales bacterium]|nr:glycosyltransferase [Anaerolineales bacterium]